MADTKRPLIQRLNEDASSVITELIYEKVNSLLGAGDQLFTMEFPARPLNGATYTYDCDDVYSVLTKPIAVQEAEFVLSDALYDTVPIVQAGNGEKLSVVYKNLLNNYVPKLDFLQDFVTDKNRLRQWLLTEVEDVNYDKNHRPADNGGKITRMELCKKLYGEFLVQRNIWAKEKNEKYNSAKGDNLLEEYAQWVTSEGVVRDEQLNNLFNDAVVRGNFHEVMTILGFLNIESPAEMLEKTKQNIRGSLRRSLDASRDVYPVQFQPTNWFKALKPNLNPKDLTMSSEALVSEYRSKQRNLQSLEQHLAELTESEVSPDRLAQLKANTVQAKEALREADEKVMSTCSEGAKNALHMAIRIYSKVANPVQRFSDALTAVEGARTKPESVLEGTNKSLFDLLENVATTAFQGMKDSYAAVSSALSAMEGALAAETEYAAAMTQNFDATKSAILTRINELTADLEYLKPLVSSTLAAVEIPDPSTPTTADAEGQSSLLPQAAEDASDSTFMDVILKSETVVKKSKETSDQAAANSSWKVGGWFFSAGHSSSSSSSSHSKDVSSDATNIEIGFRVTKVSLERGGWFDPSIFKMTNNFCHLAEMRSSGGVSKDQIRIAMTKQNTDDELKKLVTYTDTAGKSKSSYLLPSFPTAFVIAKDITIRVKVDHSEESSNKQYAESKSQSSGGFFGFSASSGSSSKHASESTYVGSRNDFVYIRIPGPQILGWFQQLVPADLSDAYKPMGDVPFNQAILRLLNGDVQSDTGDIEALATKSAENDKGDLT